MQFTPQTAVFLLIGCLVLLTLFFMVVSFAAIFVARLSGHNMLGPILGSMLKMLSVKNDADSQDEEANTAAMTPHRHINAAEVIAQSEQSFDFERSVDKYRPAAPQTGYTAEAQAVGQSLPSQPLSPFMPPAPSAGLPVTPIAPPSFAGSLPITPIAPPTAEPPEPPTNTGVYIPPAEDYIPLPPRPPTLPDEPPDDTHPRRPTSTPR